MSYRYSRTTKRRFFRRKKYFRGRGGLAKKAWYLAKKNRKQLNKELEFKHIVVESLDQQVFAAGQVFYMNQIAQGDDIFNRTGRKIRIKSVHFKILFSDMNTNCVRVMMFRDTGNRGALPAVTDVINDSTIFDYKVTNNRQRFVIMYDKVIIRQTEFAGWCEYYKKMNYEVNFRGDTSAVASAGKGAFFLLILGVANGDAENLNISIKIVYTDA